VKWVIRTVPEEAAQAAAAEALAASDPEEVSEALRRVVGFERRVLGTD